MRDKRKFAATLAGAMAVVTVAGGAMAYFTDYASKDLTANAGTLTMEMSGVTEDLTGGLTIMNPGDSNPLDFTVTNTGEKSMDVKAVITVSSDQAFDTENHEFKVTDSDGTELEYAMSNEDKMITYTIDDVALAGSIENDLDTDGSTETSKAYGYKFAMDENADNAWQDKTANVKIEVFAKQHRNTTDQNAGDWTTIVEKE